MAYMLADREVTTDELYAVGATFTLVAWAFAYLFVVLQIAQPGCFIAAVNPDQPRSWMELLFLSFTNLSSTGLSDVVPITPHARSVVMMEQLAGLGYVALFVSRLVGLTISRQMATTPRALTVAQRLVVVAHGPTGGVRQAIFGDPGHVVDPMAIRPIAARVAWWRHGPEPACAETAARLGGPGEVTERLATCDFGSWTGRSLAEVGATDPKGVRPDGWLIRDARPHGGESLSGAASCESVPPSISPAWPEGQSIVVVTPLVARAMVVHALGDRQK